MQKTDLACIAAGAVLAVIAGTATASFGLAPAEAALRGTDQQPFVVAPSPSVAAAAAVSPAVATYVSDPWPAAPVARETRVNKSRDHADETLSATDPSVTVPEVTPAIEVMPATEITSVDPPPDGDASPAPAPAAVYPGNDGPAPSR